MSYSIKFDEIAIELIIIILFCVFGGLRLFISVDNFLSTYLVFEIISLSMYILVGLNRYSNLSVEAALKYFIIGSFASCIILLGVSLIYLFTGILCSVIYYICCNL